jgi:hypothetical protein
MLAEGRSGEGALIEELAAAMDRTRRRDTRLARVRENQPQLASLVPGSMAGGDAKTERSESRGAVLPPGAARDGCLVEIACEAGREAVEPWTMSAWCALAPGCNPS